MNSKFLRVGRGAVNAQNLKNDIQVNHPSVSRSHLEVFIDSDDNVFITDLQTKNGTYVNGNSINGDYKLTPGDILKLGSAPPVQWKKWIDGFYQTDTSQADSALQNNNSSNSDYESSTLTGTKKTKSGILIICGFLALLVALIFFKWVSNSNNRQLATTSENKIDGISHAYTKAELASRTFYQLKSLAAKKVDVFDVIDNEIIYTSDGVKVMLLITNNIFQGIEVFNSNETTQNPVDLEPNNQNSKDSTAKFDTLKVIKKKNTDQDHDGVLDADDYCPNVYGDISNYGCPVAPAPVSTNSIKFKDNNDGTFSMLSNNGMESVENFISRIKSENPKCQNPSNEEEIIKLNQGVLNYNQIKNAVLPGNEWIKFKCYR